jgi:hypothetical protein
LLDTINSVPYFYQVPVNIVCYVPAEKHNDFINFLNDLAKLHKEGLINLAELRDLIIPFLNKEDFHTQEFLKLFNKEIELLEIKPSEEKILLYRKLIDEMKDKRDKELLEDLEKSRKFLIKELNKDIIFDEQNKINQEVITDIIKPIETI